MCLDASDVGFLPPDKARKYALHSHTGIVCSLITPYSMYTWRPSSQRANITAATPTPRPQKTRRQLQKNYQKSQPRQKAFEHLQVRPI